MRRAVSIALILDTLYLIGTGINQIFPPFNKQVDPNHITPVAIFLVLLSIHLWLNRKPIVKYFRGLRWKWAYVGFGVFVILWGVVGVPLLMLNGFN